MAEVTSGFGVAAGSQSGFGTINATVQGLTGALGISNGIILGDAGSGVGESGIELALSRASRDLAAVSGSYTKQFPTFLRRDLDKLTITLQLKGSGTVALSGLAANPPVDADMSLATNYPGLDALLKAAGLTGGAWGAGVGHSYVPAAVVPATIKVWAGIGSNSVAYVFQDCVCKMTVDFTPGDVALATFEISGTVVSATGGTTFPTFTFGHLSTISAPVVQNVAHSFGIGAAARDFSELSITVDSLIETFPASNSSTGERQRQTGRTITAEGIINRDTGDDDYEDTRMAATTATTDDLTFTVGSAATAGAEVKAFAVFFNNPNVTKLEPTTVGSASAASVALEATATSANAEFELRFI